MLRNNEGKRWWPRYVLAFAGVIVGWMLELLPGGAIGRIGVTRVAVLAPWEFFAPAELAKPG